MYISHTEGRPYGQAERSSNQVTMLDRSTRADIQFFNYALLEGLDKLAEAFQEALII
jgi:hypothetical protein